MGGIAGGGDQKAVLDQELLQKPANTLVVVDDQKVNLVARRHAPPSLISV